MIEVYHEEIIFFYFFNVSTFSWCDLKKIHVNRLEKFAYKWTSKMKWNIMWRSGLWWGVYMACVRIWTKTHSVYRVSMSPYRYNNDLFSWSYLVTRHFYTYIITSSYVYRKLKNDFDYISICFDNRFSIFGIKTSFYFTMTFGINKTQKLQQ